MCLIKFLFNKQRKLVRNDELTQSISAYNLLELNGDSNRITASLQDRKVSKTIQQVSYL